MQWYSAVLVLHGYVMYNHYETRRLPYSLIVIIPDYQISRLHCFPQNFHPHKQSLSGLGLCFLLNKHSEKQLILENKTAQILKFVDLQKLHTSKICTYTANEDMT